MSDALMEVASLSKVFQGRRGADLHAVADLDLSVYAGEALGLVGESGCGKSTTARLLARLLSATSGSIKFEGRDISKIGRRAMRPLRRDVQMIFQDPYSSLNPRRTVGEIIRTPLRILRPELDERSAVAQIIERVGLAPEQVDRYPHQFSGGQAQRIGIARALVTRPRLLIADEPVSALDVSVQAQIINMMSELQREFGLSYVFIAHDLAVVRQLCTRIAVMYLGRIIEIGARESVYQAPAHPYTSALLSAAPLPHPATERARQRVVLQGDPPSPAAPPPGCAFSPRCFKAQGRCFTDRPRLEPAGGRLVACHYPSTGAGS
ncbi:peptide ABC transporter ATP-binding protein [Micromonospora tulbaghiae]|uniref:Peptide ABC transporter ATP-binding protein n=1 Tax=Micromonospora tulbaghiae TaxID=479978 RepID=A0A386WHH7_9ACTN|nr:oligopeptide/dipeptide ABC transporter ATP-binding protein [Micromonospora tulbaghiae]AYF26890.1 peptide ABC transporter ATP-binding protein [Micromonospora tulbaghiae]NED56475.1 ATP-binding cassette domain-containing protein [Micromonospora aurantiaca]